jgi:hypothetical protein
LRYFLIDQGIEFTDDRVETKAWLSYKASPQVAGPFCSLPVLHWGECLVGQALAIAAYLSRRLGHDENRDATELARLDSVTSAAHLDLTCMIRELLRPRIMPQGDQWSAFLTEFSSSIPARLPAFERLLAAQEAPYFGGVAPVAADYFVFEAVDAWLELLGVPFAVALANCPRLGEHQRALLARPKLGAYVASGGRPHPLTMSPHEPEIRDRLRVAIAGCS